MCIFQKQYNRTMSNMFLNVDLDFICLLHLKSFQLQHSLSLKGISCFNEGIVYNCDKEHLPIQLLQNRDIVLLVIHMDLRYRKRWYLHREILTICVHRLELAPIRFKVSENRRRFLGDVQALLAETLGPEQALRSLPVSLHHTVADFKGRQQFRVCCFWK